jgi:RHS repeat-associated protein
VGKVDSAGTKTFKRDGADVTNSVLSDGTSVFTPGVSARTSGATSFLMGDFQKSFTRETDSNQATTATKQYDAFGALVASTGTSNSPFGFAGGNGYQEDPDSNLKLLGHRYYDSSTGRFLTRDPAQDGRNWFVYCESNPVRNIDANGKNVEVIIWNPFPKVIIKFPPPKPFFPPHFWDPRPVIIYPPVPRPWWPPRRYPWMDPPAPKLPIEWPIVWKPRGEMIFPAMHIKIPGTDIEINLPEEHIYF